MKSKYKASYKIVGFNIAYYRKIAGLTQEGLAEKSGLDISTISKLEIAQIGATLDTLYDIAGALGVDAYKLLMNPR